MPQSSNQLARFIELYQALNQQDAIVCYGTLTALTSTEPVDKLADRIRQTVEELKHLERWFKELHPELQFVFGSVLASRKETASEFIHELRHIQELFRKLEVRRSEVYEAVAILILRLYKQKATEETIERFKAIYEEMKAFSWWLTGPDDFPACAMLTASPEEPKQILYRIKLIYTALRKQGFKRGDQLQSAANLLYFEGSDPVLLASRLKHLVKAFTSLHISIWRRDYVDLAVLAFIEADPTQIAQTVLDYRTQLQTLKPSLPYLMTFTLATGITFLELSTHHMNLSDAGSILHSEVATTATAKMVVG